MLEGDLGLEGLSPKEAPAAREYPERRGGRETPKCGCLGAWDPGGEPLPWDYGAHEERGQPPSPVARTVPGAAAL